MKEKKLIITSSIILGVLVLVLGTSFAIFTFSKTSTNSKLIVGDIYMHYNETNQIQMENVMPSSTYDENTYFEFTIDGKNTYDKKDIYYEIMLALGDEVEGKTTRIKNSLLKFTLMRQVDDGAWETIFSGKSFPELDNKRIFVETVPKNTLKEIKHTYRLYMWISSETNICGGEVTYGCDYTLDDWNDVFASIKINLFGDFNEKITTVSDALCFATNELTDGTLAIVKFNKYDIKSSTPEYWNTLCDGTDVIIPNTINGKMVTSIGQESFYKSNLTSVVIPDTVTRIGDHAFDENYLTNIVIPDSVVTIGQSAFRSNQLKKATIGNNVDYIGNSAFYDNQLKEIVIPDSVTTIRASAFYANNLIKVTIGSGIKYIDGGAFSKVSSKYQSGIVLSNAYLSSITINKSCTDIKNIPAYSDSTKKYYPWGSNNSPGVTIYGSNNEVCDTF